jgi:hypothetical protein
VLVNLVQMLAEPVKQVPKKQTMMLLMLTLKR